MSVFKSPEICELAAYEVCEDGFVRLNVVDAKGSQASIAIPLESLRELALTIPSIVAETVPPAQGTAALRPIHDVKAWKIEDGEGGKAILTFSTSDHFQISFAVRGNQVHKMAELIVEHEIEAYPQGLRFH